MIRLALLALILLAPAAAADPVELRFVESSSETRCVSDGTTTYCEQEATTGGVAVASEGEDVIVVTEGFERDDRHERSSVYRDETWTNQSVHVQSPAGDREIRHASCYEGSHIRAQHDYDMHGRCTNGAQTDGVPTHGVTMYGDDDATPDDWSTDETGTTVFVEDSSVNQHCRNRNLDGYPFEQHETCWYTVSSGETSRTEQYQHCDRYVWPEITQTCRTGAFLEDGGFVGLEQRTDTDRATGDDTTTSFLVVEAAGVEQKVPVPASLPVL